MNWKITITIAEDVSPMRLNEFVDTVKIELEYRLIHNYALEVEEIWEASDETNG